MALAARLRTFVARRHQEHAIPEIPREKAPDSTAALMIEGYGFISNRCNEHGSDLFEARIELQPTICMRGRDAAELFYDGSRFQREGAAPGRLEKTLFGVGGVQGLDDEDHHHRKAMFLRFLSPDRIGGLIERFETVWRERLADWEATSRITLYDEAARVLTRAVHDWAGVPLSAGDVDRRVSELHAMIEGGGGVGPNYLQGRIDRKRAEAAITDVVEQVRNGEIVPSPGSPLDVFATRPDLDGELLDARVAAVELLNVLRPTVAIDRYVTFVALALHQHPEWARRLRDDPELTEPFVQEVRRFFPFFPFATAKVRRDFEWNGYRFPEGQRVLLDLYATNHDPKVWDAPSRFDPERFVDWEGDRFDLVPQGGGDHATGHRCAGEWTTIGIMRSATRLLLDEMDYDVPEQDLRIVRGKVPALPASGFVMTDVRGR